jgi:hypothetical protein
MRCLSWVLLVSVLSVAVGQSIFLSTAALAPEEEIREYIAYLKERIDLSSGLKGDTDAMVAAIKGYFAKTLTLQAVLGSVQKCEGSMRLIYQDNIRAVEFIRQRSLHLSVLVQDWEKFMLIQGSINFLNIALQHFEYILALSRHGMGAYALPDLSSFVPS